MKRRNLFQEISDGFKDLKAHRDGKKTLRTFRLEALPELRLSGSEVRAVRESLNLSQALFAMRLRTNTRTLQNWEQGRAQPNAQACLLIRMLERFPDMAERLAAV
jgi:putative transcriptional regulator